MNNSILGTNAHIQSSFLKRPLYKKSRQKASPLELRSYGRKKNPLLYAIIYGIIIGTLLFMLINA